MRMLKRENCTYEQFQDMRQRVLDHVPFALINDIYDSKNKIGYLYFWDSDYIFAGWERWVVRPSTTKSITPEISEEYK